ncbi:hypothetical protein J5N97_019353 [Dioscorea zingiberensis]|uniref:Aminotransferase class I/classII large domain-containing protein n=1 Tax=Dioscorea zingiberensis TaxID=325984 RepID=A0A9D5CEG1_9LILI|nr:hypothetical protein J5N97_019353 [Dioscorea zingiberensis]
MAIGSMISSPPLSKLATSKAHGEDSPYFAGWKAYDENPYHPVNNPSGVIQMGLAENQVSFDLLEEYMEQHKEELLSWGSSSSFRETALFQDYHEIRGGRAKFDADHLVLTAGATAANELLTFILANPGDSLLVPTPYYPGFDRDLRWRTRVNIIPIHCDSSNGFQVTRKALEEAYKEAEKRKSRVKGVLLTNPSNPLGTVIPRMVLEDILDFVTKKNIHLISDEIYSGSIFAPKEFVSVAEILEETRYKNSERVHIVYSLSKDLGLPGFRVGAIYSYNPSVVITATRMSSFSLVSSQTQRMLASMLSNKEFTEKYIRTNRERLRKRHEKIVQGLREAGIECLKGNAGLFVWMNLRPLLEERTVEGELKLWDFIVNEVRLNISPGSSCHCSEVGWFRVCFANMSEKTLEVALKRMKQFVEKKRRE